MSVARRVAIVDNERCVGCQLCMFACTRRRGYGGLGFSAIHVRSTGGIESGFTVIVCRACPDPPCQKVCPTGALTVREGGGVRLNVDKCIGCGYCVDACPFGAIFWNPEVNKPIVCVYCGYCVDFCPHKVLTFEEVKP